MDGVMTMLGESSNEIEFPVAPPSMRRTIALAVGVAPVMVIAISLPLKVGAVRFYHVFAESSVGWLLDLMLLLQVAFFLRLAFPPRSGMSKLQVRPDRISFIPSKWGRRYLAEPVVEAPIASKATEILLRQKGLSSGYAVIVRSTDKQEKEVYAGTGLTLHSQNEAQKITQGISAVTGLPVRLVIRRKRTDGSVEELPWSPNVHRSEWQSLANLAIGSLPIVGGAITGYLVAQPVFVLVIGLGLWFIQRMVVARFRSRKTNRSSSEIALYFANFLLFGVTYSVTAFVVIAMTHSH
jgi:hypothetical protein